jgi:hypothetical protein
MKILVDIKDSKADFLQELLHNLSFVKTKRLTPEKAQLPEDIGEAIKKC